HPCRIVYFSMEYFSELPSLRRKPLRRLIWKALEKWAVRGAAAVATVCDSIAEHLREDFRKERVVTVRNVPELNKADGLLGHGASGPTGNGDVKSRLGARPEGPVHFIGGVTVLHARCGLPESAHLLLYQGMLQEGRGLEVAVEAMADWPDLHLALIGDGPLRDSLRADAVRRGCAQRVHF